MSKTTMRDSASMRALALAALIFLPGNFIAALFSTDLFRWDDTNESSGTSLAGMGVGVKPQFWLFWVITVPVTLLVFLLYICWWRRCESQWDSAILDLDTPARGTDTGLGHDGSYKKARKYDMESVLKRQGSI